MTPDEFDDAIYVAFLECGPDPLRASDIHGALNPCAFSDAGIDHSQARRLIEKSIGRLLERGLLVEVTEDMDWHAHYRAVNVLEAIAEVSVDPPGPTRAFWNTVAVELGR